MELTYYQEKIKELVSDYLSSNNLVLVELRLFRQGSKINIRFLVDYQDGGITIDKCTEVNEALGRILDEANLIQGSYILDVSSPGVDRPLKTLEDFRRAIGRYLEV